MPASVSLHDLSYALPDNQPLFTDLSLALGPGRTGLIGRNGTGKSTLLALIAGTRVPQSGTVSRSGTLGILRQHVQVDDRETVAQFLGVQDALQRLDRIERGEARDDDLAEADWQLPQRLEEAVAQTGIASATMDRPVSTLSGGQRTRLALARLVLDRPDLILLDEPTNNLDADGRAAVADLLARWRGAAIVVSHDRTLLRLMDAIVELTSLGAQTFGGNWDHYSERKALDLAAAEHDLAYAERRMAEIDRKVQAQAERQARRDSAGRKKAARGDIPKIMLGGMKENAENTGAAQTRLAGRLRGDAADAAAQARAQIEVLTPLTVRLTPTALPPGRTVLDAVDLSGGPDPDAPLIHPMSLRLVGPERVAITGPNGAGKTTLLRLLTGSLLPTTGTVRIQVPYALLDQTVSLLDPASSIRENFARLNPDADENTVWAALARFMFRADAALQVVGTLSGGETLRAALAATIGGTTPPQLLILDEPTNHLDIHAVAELEAGLKGYDGALLVVSHDRDFLDAIAIDRTIELGSADERSLNRQFSGGSDAAP